MKKQFLLSLLAAAALTATAQEVTVDFSGCGSGSSFTPPAGWTVFGTGTTFSVVESNAVKGSTDSYYNNCYLVSPPVNGYITFDEKTYYNYYSEDPGDIYVYDMTPNGDGTFTKGAMKGNYYHESWTTQTVQLEPGHCLGFEMNEGAIRNVKYVPYVDDPTVERRSMSITSATWPEGGTPLLSDFEGNVALNAVITIKNTGNVTLNPGDENYSITVYESSIPDLFTVPVPVSVEPDQTATFTISGSFPISTITESKSPRETGEYWCGFYTQENMLNTRLLIGWTGVYARGYNFDTVIGTTPTTSLDFGFVGPGEESTRTITLRNKCIETLENVYITVPEGFTINSPAIPFTVNPVTETPHSQDIEITLGGDAVGVLSGVMSIYVGGAEEPINITLTGARAGGDCFYENFEGDAMPAGWIIDEALTLNEAGAAVLGEDNLKALDNSSSQYPRRAITPRLVAAAGEKMVFQAGTRNVNTSDSYVKVYHSTDRANWTLLKSIGNSGKRTDTDDIFSTVSTSGSYGSSPLKLFTIDMPEGEGYLAFDIMYGRIDNVYGAQLATVDHDYYFTSQTAPSRGVVNNPITVKANLNNLADAEAAGSYSVALKADDAVVATLSDVPEMVQGANEYTLSYTPHQAGTVNLSIEVTAGNYTAASPAAQVVISPETAEAEYIIGGGTATINNNACKAAPFRTYDKNAQSQMVFTSEMLSQYGMTPGTAITGISWTGWIGKVQTGPVHIYMMPTELTAIAPADAVSMTDETLLASEVYSNDSFSYAIQASKDAPEELTVFNFDTPYIYNGGNLLVVFYKSFNNYDTSGSGFLFDSTLSGNAIVRSTDNSIDSQSWIQSTGIAQTHFHYQLEPATYSGTVKDSDTQAAIEGAEVRLSSGDVLYTGTSAADGTFELNVFQADKEYNVTVSAENYNDHTGTVSFADGSVNEPIMLVSSTGSGVSNLTADGLNLRVLDDMITVDADATLRIFATNGTMLSRVNGNAISTRDLAAGVYILTVESTQGNTSVRFVKK